MLLGHIKGQWQYRGRGDIPYYIDGGAGGDLYTNGPVGVDHGYWHGFRLVRVDGGRMSTDVVPIFVPGGIRVPGVGPLRRGQVQRFEALGRQPVFVNEQKVDGLELRDPAPIPRDGITFGAALVGILRPEILLLLGIGALAFAVVAFRLPRPARRLASAGAVTVVLFGTLAAASVARDGIPDATDPANLPNPTRMWTTANESVLAPVASLSEDARRNPRKQTQDGAFRARCPGNTRVIVQSGVESRARPVKVLSRPGRIQRSVRVLRTRFRPRRRRAVAVVRLNQPAELEVRIRRGRRVLRTLRRGCFTEARRLVFRWDGRLPNSRGRLVAARRSRYRVEVKVHSDRRVMTRSRTIFKGGR